ncbi:uncharacterized protein LOC8289489 isoform X3 [Ricinus communis]|uniref:uncharacterized protein LOC8289489 isoform X3 n=1 Tax=Ricinus communis TaxID=3988 RepID=UPI000772ADCD|nr:uncharacterized protein LOC8289489 isoform X3 [Ricinus communis]|eukprot:XP_015577549.1 uncharacterized protein LOC8289489 isoform X3 [Ricinus communis]
MILPKFKTSWIVLNKLASKSLSLWFWRECSSAQKGKYDCIFILMPPFKLTLGFCCLLQIDVLEVDGVYYGFSGCHRYEAHQRLGLPTIRCKVRRGTKETLRHHLR